MLTAEKITELKTRLLGEKARLEHEIKDLSAADFGDDTDHGEEEAEEDEQIANNLGVATDFTERINDIDSALRKIADGTYGKCERCGKDIEPELLEVNPESRLCKSCKR